MSPTDMIVIGGVIAAFACFALVLGWAAHIDYRRPPEPDSAAGEDD